MKIDVKLKNGMYGVFALSDISAGTTVRKLSTDCHADKPTRTSIHIGKGQHVEDPIGIYINHSCKPTCKVSGSSIVTIDNLKKGDEITFDYRDSEITISSPFTCLCCGKAIGGKE